LDPRATLDFETRSACSLRNSGTHRYSIDPTTEVLCLAYRLPHWQEGRTGLWHPAFPHLGIEEGESFEDLSELYAWVVDGELVEGHNAWFERCVWRNKLSHWPEIRDTQWRCSAAKAASHSLPRNLRMAARALHLDTLKDDAALRTALDLDGTTVRAMTKISQPRKPNKGDWQAWKRLYIPCRVCAGTGKYQDYKQDGLAKSNQSKCPWCDGTGFDARRSEVIPPMPMLWHESRELFEELWKYCRQDVLAEEALSLALPDLNETESQIYILDQVINERGFQIDREAVDAALSLVSGEVETLNAELAELTGGVVEKATQRDQMKEWLKTEGLTLFDTRKETLDEILDREDDEELPPWVEQVTPKARRAIELMRALGRSSTAKYGKMRAWMSPMDARVRGGLLYHGAGTGRWAGAGIQPHNFPKGNQEKDHPLKKATQDELWNVLKTRDAEVIASTYGSVMEALSHGLRGAIIAGPGTQLYVADYASIEARVLLWLADDQDALKVFETGQDIYCYMADDIYGYKTNKHDHPVERGIGKIAVLGLGYQMGASKFVDTAAAGGVTIIEDHLCAVCSRGTKNHRRANHPFEYAQGVDPDSITAVKVVDAYRSKFWRVKEMWGHMEDMAILAVENGGEYTTNHCVWFVEGDFLYCQLPSGRRLAYPEPEVHLTTTSWGEVRQQLTFMGIDPYTRQWRRQSTYGGMLVENVTQAVARDIMAEALLRCERSGVYKPVLTVHDEVVSEAKAGTGNVKEFEALLTTLPEWAEGCPIGAEGWTGTRYHK
jgi:DNA polymerase